MTINKEFAKGLAKVKENDFEGALIHFNLAVEENSADVEHFAERSVAYLNLKKFELSMFDMNKAVDLDSKNSYRYSCRAFLKAKIGDYDGAIADYEKAIELDPKDSIAYNNLGLVQEQKGYKAASRKSFDQSNDLIGYSPNRFDEKTNESPKEENTPEIELEKSKGELVKNIFTKKSSFKEFIGFVGKGFKLKKNDKG